MRKNGYITGEDTQQQSFAPWCADSEVGAENAVRFVRIFVDSLDVEQMEFKRSTPEQTGRPGYAPQDLLALYLSINSGMGACASQAKSSLCSQTKTRAS